MTLTNIVKDYSAEYKERVRKLEEITKGGNYNKMCESLCAELKAIIDSNADDLRFLQQLTISAIATENALAEHRGALAREIKEEEGAA